MIEKGPWKIECFLESYFEPKKRFHDETEEYFLVEDFLVTFLLSLLYSCLFFFLTGLHFFHLLVGLLLCCLLFCNCSFSEINMKPMQRSILRNKNARETFIFILALVFLRVTSFLQIFSRELFFIGIFLSFILPSLETSFDEMLTVTSS